MVLTYQHSKAVQAVSQNKTSQWNYTESKKNPVNDRSRVLSSSNQEKVKRWMHGPELLWKNKSKWLLQNPNNINYMDSIDPQLKKGVSVNTIELKENIVTML